MKLRHICITVACPCCGAEPNALCVSKKHGREIPPHQERHAAYGKRNNHSVGERTRKPSKRKVKTQPPLTYKTYLASDAWHEKRAQRLALEDSHECWTCGDTLFVGGKHVHHRTYKNLFAETMADLVVTCQECNMRRIPFVVKCLKRLNLVSQNFQWYATDYVRRELRQSNGPGCLLDAKSYELFCSVLPRVS